MPDVDDHICLLDGPMRGFYVPKSMLNVDTNRIEMTRVKTHAPTPEVSFLIYRPDGTLERELDREGMMSYIMNEVGKTVHDNLLDKIEEN